MTSILVVEDDEAIRSALVAALIDEGYQATSTSNGRFALDHLETDGVDLLLLDLYMPLMGGLEMIHVLRQRGNATPIVMISAQPSVVLPSGVRFLCKPFDLDQLFETIDDALG